MRRIVCLLAGVLLVVPSVGSDAPREYDDKSEYVGIEGTWRWTTTSGHALVLTFHSGGFTLAVENTVLGRGSYRIDSSRYPLFLDKLPTYGPYKGVTVKCLYQIDGGALRIAYMPSDPEQRPRWFTGEGVEVETYKRVR
jgi:uncharacterized protein (TIGR03067 family)